MDDQEQRKARDLIKKLNDPSVLNPQKTDQKGQNRNFIERETGEGGRDGPWGRRGWRAG